MYIVCSMIVIFRRGLRGGARRIEAYGVARGDSTVVLDLNKISPQLYIHRYSNKTGLPAIFFSWKRSAKDKENCK